MASNIPTTSAIRWPNLIARSETSSDLLTAYTSTVRDIHHRLKTSNTILVAGHEHPDGDAIGSSLALFHALSIQNKRVTVFMPDAPPPMFSFIPGFNQITITLPNAASFDTVVLLDSTYVERTHLAQEIKTHPATICIDHHYDNQGECTVNLVVPQAAATAHILSVFFEDTFTPITKDMATCLLTGIFTDTGSFMHDSTTPEILKLAALLMKKGARLSHIAHETYQKKDLPSLKIWGRALSRIMTNPMTGATISIITPQDLSECNATLDDLTGVVNMLNTLPDTKFALLLTEYEPGKIKGSLRSEPIRGVDVSHIAKTLGGGGHKLAAGFEVEGHLVHQNGQWRVVN